MWSTLRKNANTSFIFESLPNGTKHIGLIDFGLNFVLPLGTIIRNCLFSFEFKFCGWYNFGYYEILWYLYVYFKKSTPCKKTESPTFTVFEKSVPKPTSLFLCTSTVPLPAVARSYGLSTAIVPIARPMCPMIGLRRDWYHQSLITVAAPMKETFLLADAIMS